MQSRYEIEEQSIGGYRLVDDLLSRWNLPPTNNNQTTISFY
jgi:hypothetical protein